MNIGLVIHECHTEFDLENCIDEFADELHNHPLTTGDKLFFVVENTALLPNSATQIPVYTQDSHPPIDILLVSRQSLKRTCPPNFQHWLHKAAQSAQLVVALFSANSLLTELAIFADLRIYRAGSKKTYSGATLCLKQRTNSRWQSHVVVHLKHALPAALSGTLHLIQQLESSELVRQSHKQLQFDL